ncbi:hypothetical protein [Rosenbergiella australiborealis]|uniref:Uncharacterized protein n=1 Tax=Rosenbergiella australiborealis TaxID=1544696 RepID=A0ABS5T8F2_9GAMM|nr:hypothetical protein [Rosenbergiella australiborealis]MBT0727785.1 hypothetical protein [Rosenbergiella australiborealis]
MIKLKVIVPVVAVVCAAVWWFMPHYSNQEKAYYVSLYCLQPTGSDQQILARMQQTVENNNQDYALKKRHFIPELAHYVIETSHHLTPVEQQRAQQSEACSQLLLERLHITAQ